MKTELLKKLEELRKEIEAMPDDQDDKSVDVSYFLPFIDKKTGVSLIENRNQGEYTDRSFYLNDEFNWRIETDTNKCTVLIPDRKSTRLNSSH